MSNSSVADVQYRYLESGMRTTLAIVEILNANRDMLPAEIQKQHYAALCALQTEYINAEHNYRNSLMEVERVLAETKQAVLADKSCTRMDLGLDALAMFEASHKSASLSDAIVQEHVMMKELQEKFDLNSSYDLLETVVSRDTLDPFTKIEILDPVKNIHCLHSYDRATILNVIRKNASTKCPIVCCTNKKFICSKDLVDDIKLKDYIHKKKNCS